MLPRLYTTNHENLTNFQKKRQSINANPKMTQTLELSVKPYKAAITTIITILHDIKVNTLIVGKMGVPSRKIETIEKNEIETLKFKDRICEILKITR